MTGGQRKNDGVLGGRRLQLEVEGAAEALAQCQPPGAIDAAAIGRMNDQLGAAGLVEEALHHQPLLSRQGAKCGAGTRQVFDDLSRGGFRQAKGAGKPIDGGRQVHPAHRRPLSQPPIDLVTQPRHGKGQLVAAPWRLAQPEGNARRHALSIFDTHPPGLDLEDAIRGVTQLEHIAGQALHREVLVHRADIQPLRLQQHGIVGVVGDGAAGGQCGQPATAPATQAARREITVQIGAAGSVAGRIALGEHSQQCLEGRIVERGIGRRAVKRLQQLILAPLTTGHFRDDLLRQHVQRRVRDLQRVQLATTHGVEQRGTLDQVVAGAGKQPPLGHPGDLVPGAPDPLQKGRDRAWRTQLTDQLDITDVDTQLQRGRRDQYPQLAALELLLGAQPLFAGQTAVMRSDHLCTQPLGQVAGGALGQAPRVDEHQRGAMLASQCREAVVDQRPGIVAHHRLQRHRRHFQRQVAGAAMADIDDLARSLDADQKTRHRIDRLLRRRQADPHQRPIAERFQSLQRQRQMAATLVAGNGVNLVDNHALHIGEHFAPRCRAEQHIERFRRGDEDMRDALAHGVALGLRRVAGTHRGADFQRW